MKEIIKDPLALLGLAFLGFIFYGIFVRPVLDGPVHYDNSGNNRPSASRTPNALNTCTTAIRAKLQFPSSMDYSLMSVSIYDPPDNPGRTVVRFNFTAKNGMGLELPQKAACYIQNGDIVSAEIYNR